MGSRVAVSVGIVLLIAGAQAWASAQDRFGARSNETLNQTRAAGPRPRAQLSHRLRIYQVQRPGAEKERERRPPKDLQVAENAGGGPERPGTGDPVPTLVLMPGPVLNPPLELRTRVSVIMDHRVPVPAASVATHCGEEVVSVQVKQNFFGNGQLIHPSDLTLGGCAARRTSDHTLAFQTELHGCSSVSNLTEDTLIYSFSLLYSPTPIGNTVILKTNPAEVVIECHYQRRHYVSSNALRPAWMLFAAMMQAEKGPRFSLRLMTEDWQSPKQSNVVFLSNMVHLEAAVHRGYHVPLRVYVDSCVAATTSDPDSQSTYPIIDNHGCFRDSKLTGDKSFFLQRSQEDKLQFQLKAFRFPQSINNSVHITCQLKSTLLSVPIDRQHKACSFLTEASRWVVSDGDNIVCRCCDTSCDERGRKRRLAADVDVPPLAQWEGTASLAVIQLGENIQGLPQEPPPQSPTASSSSAGALLCGAGIAVALVLLAFAVACSGMSKPTVYTVCT